MPPECRELARSPSAIDELETFLTPMHALAALFRSHRADTPVRERVGLTILASLAGGDGADVYTIINCFVATATFVLEVNMEHEAILVHPSQIFPEPTRRSRGALEHGADMDFDLQNPDVVAAHQLVRAAITLTTGMYGKASHGWAERLVWADRILRDHRQDLQKPMPLLLRRGSAAATEGPDEADAVVYRGVEMAFFATFSVLDDLTQKVWNVGCVNVECARVLCVDTFGMSAAAAAAYLDFIFGTTPLLCHACCSLCDFANTGQALAVACPGCARGIFCSAECRHHGMPEHEDVCHADTRAGDIVLVASAESVTFARIVEETGEGRFVANLLVDRSESPVHSLVNVLRAGECGDAFVAALRRGGRMRALPPGAPRRVTVSQADVSVDDRCMALRRIENELQNDDSLMHKLVQAIAVANFEEVARVQN